MKTDPRTHMFALCLNMRGNTNMCKIFLFKKKMKRKEERRVIHCMKE